MIVSAQVGSHNRRSKILKIVKLNRFGGKSLMHTKKISIWTFFFIHLDMSSPFDIQPADPTYCLSLSQKHD